MGRFANGLDVRGLFRAVFNDLDSTDDGLVDQVWLKQYTWLKTAVDGAANTVTAAFTFGTTTSKQLITNVYFMPDGTLTSNDTNYATLTLTGLDPTGATTTTLATVSTQTTGTGGSGNFVAGVAVPLVLSTVANATIVAALSSLRFAITKPGTGVAVPPGLLVVVGTTY